MYIDLVVVRHMGTDKNPYLFIAPKWSGIHAGDMVEVETVKGTSMGTVLAKCTTQDDSEEFRCFCYLAKGGPLKKVLRHFSAKECRYEEIPNAETSDSSGV